MNIIRRNPRRTLASGASVFNPNGAVLRIVEAENTTIAAVFGDTRTERQRRAAQIVSDHVAVPRLVEALEAAMKVVSDRAAGGRMLTTACEADEVWKRCDDALALTTLRRSG